MDYQIIELEEFNVIGRQYYAVKCAEWKLTKEVVERFIEEERK